MTNEPSPRPWRVETNRFGQHYIVCESGLVDRVRDYIAGPIQNEADAALIVDAVNERDRLRDIVRTFSDVTHSLVANYEDHYRDDQNSMEYVANVRELIREARAAIGERTR